MSRSSKSRSSKNIKRTRAPRLGMRLGTRLLPMLAATALAAGVLPGGVCPAARAAGFVYQQHTLNAGVLVNGTDPAPYLFYVLNNRPDIRPTDLNLVNPLAPAGADPKTAAYWEVSLYNVSDSELAQYDVLYLPAGAQTFAPALNERLRRFVDNGGQLIVEYGTATSPTVPGLFTGTTQVAGTAGNAVTLPQIGNTTVSLRHPVVSQPFFLAAQKDAGSGLEVISDLVSPAYCISVNTTDLVHSGEVGNIFSPVLTDTSGAVLSAAQIGGGQAVVSALNLGPNISGHNAATFAPADLYAAPAADLKILANILNWAEAHPSENKTSHGNAFSTGLASFSPAWQFLPMASTAATTPAAPSGAAVWGNFVFAVGADGFLRAFDADPAESLTGSAAVVDDGVTDYSGGTSYDEIWEQKVRTGASTPTIAAFGSVNYVFVEEQDGSVAAFNAVTGAAAPFTLTAPATGGTFSGPAPGPTYYDGRLYAGQADGTLHVYDLNEGTAAVVPLDPNVQTGGEPVTAAPSVGTLADGDTNVLVAIVPTTLNVYSVLLGGRNEPLVPYNVNGTLAGYSINRLGRYDLSNIFADVGYSSLLAYDNGGNIYPNSTSPTPPNSTAPNPQDPLFAITNNAGYYTDWNMDFPSATGTSTGAATPNQVNINFISAASYGELQSPTAATLMSAAAIDRRGDYYYTETLGTNSYLVGVTNAPLYSRVHLKFRFRLPTAADGSFWNYVDGDGVYYNDIADGESLVGYHFVGAPVVDDQGNVYAAATNGTDATVLCFRGDQPISATLPAGSTLDLTSETITQPDEGGGTANTIQRGPDTGVGTANATYGQFIASAPTDASGNVTGPSTLQFYNFGKQGTTIRQIAGNLTEPQPLTATSTDGQTTTTTLLMQTNLAWFAKPFSLYAAPSGNGGNSVSQIAGLTQVGSSLLLTDGVYLYRLPSNPVVGANKVVAAPPSKTPVGVDNGVAANAGLGAVASVPSVGGSVMAINGANGLAARTRQITVIADSGRVLGVDGDGNAVWAVDATTHADTTASPGIATKVPFSHPTALSQFALNDYLVADTGNNRCVRFDSGGNVQWELTRFQDPAGLLGAGQPLTLNQPASVVVRTIPDTATSTANGTAALVNPGGSFNYYLVADSGHNRIVEVEDRVNSSGGIFVDTNNNNATINHVLTWASHTGDQGGRSYRYGSAAYYRNTATPSGLSIAATVTNTRLAPLVANPNTNVGGTLLGPASGDAPGGSIVVFNYPQAPVPFSSLGQPGAPSDLAYTTAGFYAASGSGSSTTYTPFTIRNPRFLQLSAPSAAYTAAAPNGSVAPFDFLYADDNGAFDLTYDAAKGAFVAGADRLQFKASDYGAMTTPVDASTSGGAPSTSYTRTGLPFIPTCVQALSTDSQTTSGTPGGTGGGTAVVTRRYLITQNYSQGELGNTNATGKIGGEVFEIDVSAPVNYPAGTVAGTTPPPSVTAAPKVTAPGGFGNDSTLSHPALTGPLTQPTYAVRLP